MVQQICVNWCNPHKKPLCRQPEVFGYVDPPLFVLAGFGFLLTYANIPNVLLCFSYIWPQGLCV